VYTCREKANDIMPHLWYFIFYFEKFIWNFKFFWKI